MEETKIGIIGGMGPEATSELYTRLLKVCQEELEAVQDSDYPEIFVDSVSFKGSDESGVVDEETVLEQFLVALENLEYAGSDLVLVPCNTLHSLMAELKQEAQAEIVDMVDETVSRVEADGVEKVGLLASETSYEKKIYQQRTDEVEFLVPDEKGREELSDIILNIMAGEKIEEDRQKLKEMAGNLEKRGAEAIILGCTELPVILKAEELDQKTYDTVQILAEKAVER